MTARSRLAIRCLTLGAVLATVGLLASGCGGGGDNTAGNDQQAISGIGGALATSTPNVVADTVVNVADNTFTPGTINVKRGGKVTWKWSGSNPHQVLIAGAKSPEMTGTGTWDRTFNDEAGTVINYQCAIHGAAMSGKIIIE